MRILVIAMADSIHTVRWINQISDQGWDIHLFPSIDDGNVHSQLRNVTVYHSAYAKPQKKANINPSVKNRGFYIPFYWEGIGINITLVLNEFLNKYIPDYSARRLRRLIKKLKPDIVHSLEFQHSSYLALQALNKIYIPINFWNIIRFSFRQLTKKQENTSLEKVEDNSFPLLEERIVGQSSKWIATNWGSDIYLFGRLAEHKQKIKQVLSNSDYYSCECKRDVGLAMALGFKGKVLPVFPNTGGFNLEKISKLKSTGPTSERRLIMLKGYQSWAHRALVGLRALERCADLLKEYTIAIYSAPHEVKIAAELFEGSTGIPVKIIPKVSHEEILSYHGQARISIGIGISDAISTSFLEALVMGSFPIQSWTACANEWVEDGITGLLVPPEDPDVIETAIRNALVDDNLVNHAAELNWGMAVKKLDHIKLKNKSIEFYKMASQS